MPGMPGSQGAQSTLTDAPETPARVRGRLAPSPTGFLHLGNAWTFLLCWLATRSQNGTLVLRMEDIDPERSRPEFAEAIMRDLDWLGLEWDEGPDVGGPYGPYVQSMRLDRYADIITMLTDCGYVYPCYCTRKELRSLASAPHMDDCGPVYPGTCRGLSVQERAEREASGKRAALRLRCDASDLCFTDSLKGLVCRDWNSCGGDFAVRRSDGVFAYQLAVAVDDADQAITQVVRGDDILLSTPRQIWLLRLMGAALPQYMHVPLVFDSEGARLAKRHQHYELRALREAGVAPEHIIGYLAFRAGLQPELAPLRPQALVRDFRPQALPGAPVLLEDDIFDRLRTL